VLPRKEKAKIGSKFYCKKDTEIEEYRGGVFGLSARRLSSWSPVLACRGMPPGREAHSYLRSLKEELDAEK